MLASVDWTAVGTVVLASVALLGLAVEWVRHDRTEIRRQAKIDQLLTEVRPNGGQTQSLGDIAKRTEEKVTELTGRFDQHLGHSDAVEREVFTRLRHLENHG